MRQLSILGLALLGSSFLPAQSWLNTVKGAVKSAAPTPSSSAPNPSMSVSQNGSHALATGTLQRATTEGKACISPRACRSFEEARSVAVSTVKDGDPVFLHLKLPKPVSAYAHKWHLGTNDVMHKDRLALHVEVGPAGEATTYHSSNVLLTEEELKGQELCIGLAPGEVRPLAVDAWLKTVGGGAPGRWANEIRVKYGSMEGGSYHRKLLAVVPLTADVSSGIQAYQAQLAAYTQRQSEGNPEWNVVPQPGKLMDPGALAQITQQLKASIPGAEFKRVFFTLDDWFVHRNRLGQVEKHSSNAAATYKKNGKSYVAWIDVVRWHVGNRVESKVHTVQPIRADKL